MTTTVNNFPITDELVRFIKNWYPSEGFQESLLYYSAESLDDAILVFSGLTQGETVFNPDINPQQVLYSIINLRRDLMKLNGILFDIDYKEEA